MSRLEERGNAPELRHGLDLGRGVIWGECRSFGSGVIPDVYRRRATLVETLATP